MGDSPSQNNIDLGAQQREADKQLKLQQQQWAAEQAQSNQATQAGQDLTAQQLKQATDLANQKATSFQAANAAQGTAQNATGGAAGIKAASTLANNTLGLSPQDQKLQAAGVNDPNSLANLNKKRLQSQSNTLGSGANSLASSVATLGGT